MLSLANKGIRVMRLFDLLKIYQPEIKESECKIHLAGWNGMRTLLMSSWPVILKNGNLGSPKKTLSENISLLFFNCQVEINGSLLMGIIPKGVSTLKNRSITYIKRQR